MQITAFLFIITCERIIAVGMLKDLAAAFDRKDYRTAAQLLQQWRQESPQEPWVKFYTARLQEASGKLPQAEELYRQLLQATDNPKIMGQVRQSLERVEALQRSQRQAAIAQAMSDPQNQAIGFMVLEAVTGDARNLAIQNFARVMQIDAYTARMLIPMRGWRLYRCGALGELQVYGEALQAAEIPVFWAALPAIERIQTFQVKYFQTNSPQPEVICQDQKDQLGKISFDWSEVHQWVEGMLPIFEQVVDLGYRDRLIWKESTQDYAHFCDLHLPSRNCILRIHDSAYVYTKGIAVLPQDAAVNALDRNTIRTNWNGLLALLQQHLPNAQVWSDFTTFGESAADFDLPLDRLKSQIYLARATDTYWDKAFHLYSCLAFLHLKI